MNITRTTVAAVLALGTLLLGTGPATASGPNPRLLVSGLGTHTSGVGSASYAGHSYSDVPFAGDFTGTVTVTDGSFPPLGGCEPASAVVRLSEEGGSGVVQLAATGEVCSILVGAWTMQQFKGRWTVVETNVRKVARTEGIIDLRLLSQGDADLYAWGR